MIVSNKSTRPKLLILTSSFPGGPADETCGYIRDFARRLTCEFEVQVLAPPDKTAHDWPADDFTLVRSASFFPDSIDAFQATRDFNDLPVRNILERIGLIVSLTVFFVKALKLAAHADAICSHWLVPSGVVGAAIARLTGKPHIVVEHSGALHLLSGMRGGRLLATFVVSASKRVITVSDDLKRKLVALCPDAREKVEVIPMGVSETEAEGVLPTEVGRLRVAVASAELRKPVVLFIGRLTEVKGVDVLIRAMQHVAPSRLVVAGDGEQRPYLEALAVESAIDAVFLGRVRASERARLLEECEAVVVPSRLLASGRTEGTPVVCLEAMAAGRPVIAAQVGGLAEIIVDGQNGLLFEAGDELALAGKLNLLLGDSGLKQTLAMNGRVTAAAHSWPRIGSRFAEIIKASLKKNDRAVDDQELDRRLAGC
jgi:glycosyltransferase involved in cell wall biosynthesis